MEYEMDPKVLEELCKNVFMVHFITRSLHLSRSSLAKERLACTEGGGRDLGGGQALSAAPRSCRMCQGPAPHQVYGHRA
ncbi:hypothetical protein AAFF_G00139840 [Aldrovandia affinis]|uniref:Uncharacterized protein n=1 Tax=Aldrovandia affinis TaxID=143900 RepID=A0AAD7X2U8_9TELE|nr:hypothetical protein AAFF_G00139840 [Aldrovandia affinis]